MKLIYVFKNESALIIKQAYYRIRLAGLFDRKLEKIFYSVAVSASYLVGCVSLGEKLSETINVESFKQDLN